MDIGIRPLQSFPTRRSSDLTFDDEGKSKKYNGYYRFDVARNWTLVEALIENKDATLQYLFISNGLRKLLLDYASTQEVDPEILRRAEILLRSEEHTSELQSRGH